MAGIVHTASCLRVLVMRCVSKRQTHLACFGKVPGAPFSLVGDARIFNAACSFGDTGMLQLRKNEGASPVEGEDYRGVSPGRTIEKKGRAP
eukprot:1541650-Rhodomonas_salina.3